MIGDVETELYSILFSARHKKTPLSSKGKAENDHVLSMCARSVLSVSVQSCSKNRAKDIPSILEKEDTAIEELVFLVCNMYSFSFCWI